MLSKKLIWVPAGSSVPCRGPHHLVRNHHVGRDEPFVQMVGRKGTYPEKKNKVKIVPIIFGLAVIRDNDRLKENKPLKSINK